MRIVSYNELSEQLGISPLETVDHLGRELTRRATEYPFRFGCLTGHYYPQVDTVVIRGQIESSGEYMAVKTLAQDEQYKDSIVLCEMGKTFKHLAATYGEL